MTRRLDIGDDYWGMLVIPGRVLTLGPDALAVYAVLWVLRDARRWEDMMVRDGMDRDERFPGYLVEPTQKELAEQARMSLYRFRKAHAALVAAGEIE